MDLYLASFPLLILFEAGGHALYLLSQPLLCRCV